MQLSRPLALTLLTGLLLTACGNSGSVADTTKPVVGTFTVSPTTPVSGDTVSLSATATDDVGVTKVDFYRGTTLVASDSSAPYTATDTLTGVPAGTLTYRAVASDAAGNVSTDATATVTVSSTTTPPPTTGDTTKPVLNTFTASPNPVAAQGKVSLQVSATDNVAIAKVDFYRGSTLVGTDTAAPYSFDDQLPAGQTGTVAYRTVVTDTAGNTTEGTTSVNVDSVAPTVALTATPNPVTGSNVVTLSATASDDDQVSRVEFYRGNALIGTVSTAPYTFQDRVTAAQNGTQVYSAVAFDRAGNRSAASQATVTVAVDTGEPNDSVATATPLNLGAPLRGLIAGQPRDFDYYKFSATAGDQLKLSVKSVSVDAGSTLDPYVMILMPDGKTVLEKDDDGGAGLESEIRFNVPATGTYTAVVTSFAIHDDPTASDDKATNSYQIQLTRR